MNVNKTKLNWKKKRNLPKTNVNRKNQAWNPNTKDGVRKPEENIKHKNRNNQTWDPQPSIGGRNSDDNNVNSKNEIEKEKEKEIVTFESPKRAPTNAEVKKMFGKAIELAVKLVMKKHLYKFNSEVREQGEGGAIGLRATGAVALCVMLYWHREVRRRLKTLKIELDIYGGFVDDVALLTDEIEKGSKIVGNEIIIDDEKKKVDENRSEEEITMDIIEEVAQSILKMIKVTTETPCKFVDNKLPVLDLKMWVNHEE